MASESGEARALIRFLWGDSSKRTSWYGLGLLHCPGMQPGVAVNTPEMSLCQSETCWKIKTRGFQGYRGYLVNNNIWGIYWVK